MRLAVISDLHANLEALDAVLRRARDLGATDYACLGDVVGYGADPEACVERVRALPLLAAIRGNHDTMVATGDIDPYTNPRAVLAVVWTREVLPAADLAWLGGLPLSRVLSPRLSLVHDSPAEPGSWRYITDERDGALDLEGLTTNLCFYGHTHQPLALQRGVGRLPFDEQNPLVLDPAGTYLVNIGSVGQPRDGDPRASFGIYDDDQGVVELHRVSYDIAGAQARIRAAGLPEVLAERLQSGR
jgi:diadenosine tetraphosphatase ApaH/serine/threonine PP2A family protein phosphatase